MKRESVIWLIVLVIGLVLLGVRFAFTGADGFGKAYATHTLKQFVNVGTDEAPEWIAYDSEELLDHDVANQEFEAFPDGNRISWTTSAYTQQREYAQATAENPAQNRIRFSWWHTIGIWVAAFFTLAIFSFLYQDNPFYKIAEAVVVGVSAAYWMVVGFWDVLVPNLIGRLLPEVVQNWAMPGLSGEAAERDLFYLIPLILGVLLLMRLSPKGAWLSRWPLAFIIGTTAGIRLIGFIHADFLSQIRNTIVPLFVIEGGGWDAWESLKNLIIIVGVFACLVYFFFSFEHKGVVGKTARVGIWFLMITFGAGFGYTVMGRIALLAIRLEFLFDDWLWLIDPTQKRLVEVTAILGLA